MRETNDSVEDKTTVDYVTAKQYRDDEESRLYVFFASSYALNNWAGVPRKTWRFRSFYQRMLEEAEKRLGELKSIWERSADSGDSLRVMIPTAITIALMSEPKFTEVELEDGAKRKQFDISYRDPGLDAESSDKRAAIYANRVLGRIRPRLSPDQRRKLDEIAEDPELLWDEGESDDPVWFDAVNIQQLALDPVKWRKRHDIDTDSPKWQSDVVEVLGRIARPAHVIDGQHRLISAARTDAADSIYLPVVVIPRASWADQTFHFVSINSKAEPIQAALLRDILANSASETERESLRRRFQQVNIDLDILAIAGQANIQKHSPFKDLVKLRIEGEDPGPGSRIITPNTVENLTEGAYIDKGAGFRVHEGFYNEIGRYAVRARNEDLDDKDIENAWKHPATGLWWEYFYAFWRAVRDYYNHQAAINTLQDIRHPSRDETQRLAPLWGGGHGQSPLMEAHVMRTLQRVFLDHASSEIASIRSEFKSRRKEFISDRNSLVETGRYAARDGLSVEDSIDADWSEHVEQQGIRIPPELDEIPQFEEWVKSNFLSYIPVRYFQGYWEWEDTNNESREEMRDSLKAILSSSLSDDSRAPKWDSIVNRDKLWTTISAVDSSTTGDKDVSESGAAGNENESAE